MYHGQSRENRRKTFAQIRTLKYLPIFNLDAL